ncbi:unnamed protein product [Spirodela intermedia]|uniref:Uncharacterized protein n=1 Tax=Spirodela intermedia TaxID=51605 RepID=A0A7I8JTE0_SPIIN|nr:unnamed protein product [Spirodela intermedia]CAA6673450.1 unnamed protein product [Spirodela intermedia]
MGRRIVSGGCHPAERKTATLRLSGGCHPTERSWMEVGRGASPSGPRSKRRLFIAPDTLSGGEANLIPHHLFYEFCSVYIITKHLMVNKPLSHMCVSDYSLPHAQLATSDVEGE